VFNKKKQKDVTIEFSFDEQESTFDIASLGRNKKKKLPAWMIIPIIAALGGFIYLISLLVNGDSLDTGMGIPLQATEVVRGDIQEVFTTYGVVDSGNITIHYSPVSAPITEFNAVVGHYVNVGELLVSYDTTFLERDNISSQLSYQHSLNATEAAMEQNERMINNAEQAHAETINHINDLALQVNRLAGRVNTAWSTYNTNVGEANVANHHNQARGITLQQSMATHTIAMNAASDALRIAELGLAGRLPEARIAFEKPPVERNETEQILADLYGSYHSSLVSFNYHAFELELLMMELNGMVIHIADNAGYYELLAQYDVLHEEWRRASEGVSTTAPEVGMTEGEIDNLTISNSLAELAVLSSEELLRLGEEGMLAEKSGVISFVDPLHSNIVSQGMAIFAIACTEELYVNVEIASNEHNRVELGQSVSINIGNNHYEGIVSHINHVATPGSAGTPVIVAQISINNPDEHIRIGVSARITIVTQETEDVLLIPIEAVNASHDRDYVYIIEDGIIQERTIEIGISSGLMIEAISGLEDGDIVINDFNVNIVAGARATPILPGEYLQR
jgi:multidrug efflux pump subunit AcrA (membrane-fusion protein)